jgi:hypothetical protein
MASSSPYVDSTPPLPDYVPVPDSAFGPALNEQGYFVGRVERNLFWVTHQSAFLATPDGVVLFDAPPTIRRKALDDCCSAGERQHSGRGLVHPELGIDSQVHP